MSKNTTLRALPALVIIFFTLTGQGLSHQTLLDDRLKELEKKSSKTFKDSTSNEKSSFGTPDGYKYMAKYIKKNSPQNEVDYFKCALIHLILNPNDSANDPLIFEILLKTGQKLSQKKTKKTEKANKVASLCVFKEEIKSSKIFKQLDFEGFVEGKNNAYFASILVKELSSKLPSVKEYGYVLKVLSNIFGVEIHPEMEANDLDTEDLSSDLVSNRAIAHSHRKLIYEFLAECATLKHLRNQLGLDLDFLQSDEERRFKFKRNHLKLVERLLNHDKASPGRTESDSDDLELYGELLNSPGTENSDICYKNELFMSFSHLYSPSPVKHTYSCYPCEIVIKGAAKEIVTLTMHRNMREKDKGSGAFSNMDKHFIDQNTDKIRQKIKEESFQNPNKNVDEKKREVLPGYSDRMLVMQQMANRGNVRAMNQIANMLYFGNDAHGVAVDRDRAFDNFRRAAAMGDDLAQTNLGILGLSSKNTIFVDFSY